MLSGHIQIRKRPEVGVSPTDKLDVSIPSRRNLSSGVVIQTSEWKKFQQQSCLRVGKIPTVESGSQLLPSGENPISGVMTSIRT